VTRAGLAPRGERWTERTVAWYERANERSDYAERVLAAVAPVLASCRSALDVGAGFGALALPLAARLEAVTALEPSPPMAAALRRAIARRGVTNLTVAQARWGERELPVHDLVVCAHVGPLLDGGSPFLAALPRLARRAFVVIRDAPGGDDKFFFSELYPRLLGRPYARNRPHEDTLDALRRQGLSPAILHLDYRSDQPFESLEEACDFWMTYMGLEDEASRDFLRAFLAERLSREAGGWVAPFRKRAMVAWGVISAT
jgi:SAM-dependent methyltransferase